jgi:diguanylate cyclase (GGDEF)-like protein
MARDALALGAVIVEHIDVGVFAVDTELRIVLWNDFMARHSGVGAAEVMGRSLFECFPDLPRRWLEQKLRSVILLRSYAFTSWEQRPWLFRFEHDRPVTGGIDGMRQNCTFMPVENAAGKVTHVCVTVFDVTDVSIYQHRMQAAHRRLEELSVRDGLTGLFNRRHLELRLEEEFSRACRHHGQLSVLMFDVDHFKQVNDEHGHRAGDDILRAIADRTHLLLRASDIAGRYGGEEFTLVLPETGRTGAVAAAERLRRAVSALPFVVRDRELKVTVSIGVSSLTPGVQSHEALLDAADRALYVAKRDGRDRVAVA